MNIRFDISIAFSITITLFQFDASLVDNARIYDDLIIISTLRNIAYITTFILYFLGICWL